MTISSETKAAQAAYAARPYIVRGETDFFGGAFRFATEAEAVAYVADQAAKYHRDRRHGHYSTWFFELVGGGRCTTWDADDITDGVR